jgi:hypothetical protein
MKQNLQKVITLSTEKTPQVQKALTNYLYLLYNKYNECFCSAILELPVHAQLEVIHLLSSKVPNIKAKLVANATPENRYTLTHLHVIFNQLADFPLTWMLSIL